MNTELLQLLERQGISPVDGKLPILAGGAGPTEVGDPASQPLLGPTVTGTEISIDVLRTNPTVIPPIIRALTAQSQGYFMEEIFATPGLAVPSGAMLYEQTYPENYFLPEGKSLRPRSPGAPAPRVAATRHQPQLARSESWSGTVEITDEARRRNDVYTLQRQFTQLANTYIDTLQRRGLEVLKSFIEETERSVKASNKWTTEVSEGPFKVDPKKLPASDFAKTQARFYEDKAGRMPNLLILHPQDALRLEEIYSGGFTSLPMNSVLANYNLRLKVSPHATEHEAIFLESQAVGLLAYETPLRSEYTREGWRFTDVYTTEMTPLFAAFDASAILAVTEIS